MFGRVQCGKLLIIESAAKSKNGTICTHQNERHFREHCRVVYELIRSRQIPKCFNNYKLGNL